MEFTVKPMSDYTWLRPVGSRGRSRFTAGYADTLGLLNRELVMLNAHGVVIELDVAPTKIRRDGMLYANTRPNSPGVVLSFDSRILGQTLTYRADAYGTKAWGSKAEHVWQDNLRAIAVTLEALRAVDRWGATHGEQYSGFAAIGAGPGTGIATGMTATDAIGIIRRAAGLPDDGATAVTPRLVKQARVNTHPDANGGDRTQWNLVEQAEDTLRRAGKIVP